MSASIQKHIACITLLTTLDRLGLQLYSQRHIEAYDHLILVLARRNGQSRAPRGDPRDSFRVCLLKTLWSSSQNFLMDRRSVNKFYGA